MQIKLPTTGKIALTLNQARLSAALKFSIVTVAVVALYYQDLNMVFTGAITNETTYHIIAIPFLFAYLLFRKRKMVNATQDSQTVSRGIQKYFSALIGVLLSAVAVLAYWYGSYTFTPIEYHMLTLPFLAAGLILVLFSWQTLKQVLLPIAFLFFLTPPPDAILYGLGSTLANASASASNTLANLFGMHATLSTNYASPIITLIRSDQTTSAFNVDVACSGIYSIIGFTIFALFIAYLTRGKIVNKLAILVMGIPLIIALNIIRITTILAIGYNFSENLALQIFHTVGATALMFIGTILLLAITEKALKQHKPTPPCPTCNPISKPLEPFCPNCGKLLKQVKTKLTRADIAKILSIVLVTIMLLSIQAPVFALTQAPPGVMVQTPKGIQTNTLTSLLPNVNGYALNYVYRDTQFEQLSGDDQALIYAYGSHDETVLTTWVAVQIAPSVSSEHRWETCLENFPISQGKPASINQLDVRDVQLQANPPITARYFAFQYKSTNQTQVVLYWYETATFTTNTTAQTKSVMMSLVQYPTVNQNISQAEANLLPVAKEVNGYWQPIKTWTTVALALSQNGLALSEAATIMLIALLIYGMFLNYQDKASLLKLYRKLPAETQALTQAITNAQKQKNPTRQGITDELNKLTKTVADQTWLNEKLSELENVGLIKKAIANNNDEPSIQWRNLVPQRIDFVGQLKNLFIS